MQNSKASQKPKTVVIKLSGKVLDEASALRELAGDIAKAQEAGMRTVIVHGGGKQLDRLCAQLDLPKATVGGRRITDSQTLAAAKMAFVGEVLTSVLEHLAACGLKPVGLHGPACIHAKRRPPKVIDGKAVDFGHVGDITEVDLELLETLLGAGYIPVIAPLAGDRLGHTYNVNADTIAAEVAVALQADLALLLSDVPGILRDLADEESLIPELSCQHIAQLVQEGVVNGGMLPKLEASSSIVDRGVGAVRIASGFAPKVVSNSLGLGNGSAGTLIV